jgi:hypothetical protein
MDIQSFGSVGANRIPLLFVQYTSDLENLMRNAHLRYHYRPTRNLAPRWLQRLWALL